MKFISNDGHIRYVDEWNGRPWRGLLYIDVGCPNRVDSDGEVLCLDPNGEILREDGACDVASDGSMSFSAHGNDVRSVYP